MRSLARYTAGLLLCSAFMTMKVGVCSVADAAEDLHSLAAAEARLPLTTRGLYQDRAGAVILSPSLEPSGNEYVLGGHDLHGLVVGAYADGEKPPDGRPEGQRPRLFGNELILLDVNVEGSVHGALGEGDAAAQGNRLVLHGRYAFVDGKPPLPSAAVVSGALAEEAANNILVVHSGVIMGDAAGADGLKAVSGNSAIIRGGSVEGRVVGGCSLNGQSTGNLAFMTGGRAQSLIGGEAKTSGVASSNAVFFSGGVTSGIIGGMSGENHADDNSISISGGDFLPPPAQKGPAAVIGGLSRKGSATNNRISLSGKINLQNCLFWGGSSGRNSAPAPGQDLISGNTLTLEEDYQGMLPAVRNFESLVVKSQGTLIPPGNRSLPHNLQRFVLEGGLLFAGNAPGVLRFDKTQYEGDAGHIEIRLHNGKKQQADKIVFEQGALLQTPVRVRLQNPQLLKPGEQVLLMEIDQASTMQAVNRRYALVWSEEPALTGEEAEKYEIRLVLCLGGDDKDHWLVEKRRQFAKKKPKPAP